MNKEVQCILLDKAKVVFVVFAIMIYILEIAYTPSLAAENEVKAKNEETIVAIDAGHQKTTYSGLEAIGPGAKTKKAKYAAGTQGISTKVRESVLTLTIAKKLKKELVARGYKVVMIRKKAECKLTNIGRAKKANKSGADIYIRLHADGINNAEVHGASALYPTPKNPYISKLSKKSKKLSKCVLDSMCKETKASNRGLSGRDDLTGSNWAKMPVTLIEMGFMTNPTEDKNMQDEEYQEKLVQGIANGIDAYFE